MLTTWRPATLSERDRSTGVSAFCEFCKIFRRVFLQNTPWQPLLTQRWFFFFQTNEACSLGTIYLWSNTTWGKCIHWRVLMTYVTLTIFFTHKHFYEAGNKEMAKNGKRHYSNIALIWKTVILRIQKQMHISFQETKCLNLFN